MNRKQKQIVKDALNIGIESRTRDISDGYPDDNQEINHDLETIDKAWDILFNVQPTPDTKYNGWTNYPTWRINLEIFDGYDPPEDITIDDVWCKEYAEQIIFADDGVDRVSLVASYASAFISDVNWYEIAEGINEIQKEDTA